MKSSDIQTWWSEIPTMRGTVNGQRVVRQKVDKAERRRERKERKAAGSGVRHRDLVDRSTEVRE